MQAGKGVHHHSPCIGEEDMACLSMYFSIDHMSRPNPRVLQRNVIFNIIYYLCCHGQENLYIMTKDWFDIVSPPQGPGYVMQIKDELDKNHREDDYNLTVVIKRQVLYLNSNY